tara:strand:- start:1289 stop:2614 length:1326 start_codon:yes stop_codon:yes gene_type:complete
MALRRSRWATSLSLALWLFTSGCGEDDLPVDAGAPDDAEATGDAEASPDAQLTPDAARPDGRPATILADPSLPADTAGIVRVDELEPTRDPDGDGQVRVAGVDFTYEVFRNESYRCGRTGNHKFMTIQRTDALDRATDTWVYLRGGGTGYYVPTGDGPVYVGREALNDEPDVEELAGRVVMMGFDGSGLRDTAIGRRLAEGTRVVAVAYCDHDLYGGTGHPYSDNPVEGATVDGLSAAIAATSYVRAAHPEGRLWLHGSSAGSVGAYHLSRALAARGVEVAGALLDAGTFTSLRDAVMGNGCPPYSSVAESELGLNLQDQVEHILRKVLGDVSPEYLAAYEAELLEHHLGTEGAAPYFIVQGADDPYCCGGGEFDLLPGASAEGNCRFVNSVFDPGLARGTESAASSRVVVVPGAGHVVSGLEEGTFQDEIEAWIASIRTE